MKYKLIDFLTYAQKISIIETKLLYLINVTRSPQIRQWFASCLIYFISCLPSTQPSRTTYVVCQLHICITRGCWFRANKNTNGVNKSIVFLGILSVKSYFAWKVSITNQSKADALNASLANGSIPILTDWTPRVYHQHLINSWTWFPVWHITYIQVSGLASYRIRCKPHLII